MLVAGKSYLDNLLSHKHSFLHSGSIQLSKITILNSFSPLSKFWLLCIGTEIWGLCWWGLDSSPCVSVWWLVFCAASTGFWGQKLHNMSNCNTWEIDLSSSTPGRDPAIHFALSKSCHFLSTNLEYGTRCPWVCAHRHCYDYIYRFWFDKNNSCIFWAKDTLVWSKYSNLSTLMLGTRLSRCTFEIYSMHQATLR